MDGQADHAEFELYRHLCLAVVDASSVHLYREPADRQLWCDRRNEAEHLLRYLQPGDRSGYRAVAAMAVEFGLLG